MLAIFLFGFILGHVVLGSVTGFCMSIYLFRPKLIPFIAKQLVSGEIKKPNLVVGMSLAIAIPLIAGTSYSLSETNMMAEIFGKTGELFWLWVLIAFTIGFLIGSFILDKSEN